MNELRTAAQQALEAMENTSPLGSSMESYDKFFAAITALRAALEQQAEQQPMHPELRKMWEDHFDKCFRAIPVPEQAEPDAYGYASRLAVAIWEKHYKDTAPHWKPLDDLMGVLTQIDNMTSGLTRLAHGIGEEK